MCTVADPQVAKLTANSAIQRILPGQEGSQAAHVPAEEILAQLAQSSSSMMATAQH